LQEAAMARLRTWARFLDPDVQHSRQVTRLALELYDGLVRDRVLRSTPKQRRILEAAALLHDVGALDGHHAHHKKSCRLIQKLPVPLGWRLADLRAIAAIARYHRGALPRPQHKCWRYIPVSARPAIIRLAGVLRLANAFDGAHDRKIRHLKLRRDGGLFVIHADGYSGSEPRAQRMAAARHLLEASCQIALTVRPSGKHDIGTATMAP
jgi:exopolyphosphatase/guanosine-5'-triphosphate,3'-diphosphate pyrophosphatase